MPTPGGDPPRSPTGRVPQWVHDELTLAAAPDAAWRRPPGSPTPPPAPTDVRRRRRPAALPWLAGVVVAVVAGVAWWSTDPFAPPPTPAPSPPAAATPAPGLSVEPAAPDPGPEPEPPSADVVALADEAFLSDAGRELFFGARPEVLGADEFAGRCARHAALVLPTGAVGCYRHGPTPSIVVYAPADPRLRGAVVETVAHETLHAAWETLDAHERADLTVLLEAELAALPADARIHEQVAGSVGDRPEARATELFAYVGTQVWRDGGLDAGLEEVYARFVADRAALVAVHTGWRGMLEGMRADIEAAQRAVAERHQTVAQDRARFEGDSASVAFYRQSYEEKVAEVASMAPDERERLQLSWTWWDGTDLPMAPADQTLATAAGLLARDDDALAARAATLATEEAAVADERARVEALITDYEGLNAQLVPGEPPAEG